MRDLAAEPVAVAVEGEVLLSDPDRAAAGLPADVHVETRPGADHDVRLQRPQMVRHPRVGQPAVLPVPAVAAREHRRGPGVLGGVAVVRRALLPQVDEVAHAHPLGGAQRGNVTVPEDRHDLDVVVPGQRPGEIERRADRAPDSVGVVEQERNVHETPYLPVRLISGRLHLP